jgi:hypothetical protein
MAPVTISEKKLSYGSKIVQPAWKKKPSTFSYVAIPAFWGSAAYGLSMLGPALSEDSLVSKKEWTPYAALFGVLSGLVMTPFHLLCMQWSPVPIKVTENEIWVNDYNKNTGLSYVIKEEYPNGELLLYLNRENDLITKDKLISNVTWEPAAIFDSKIFPSFVIGFSEAGASFKSKNSDISNIIGFTIESNDDDEVVMYEIEPVEKEFINNKVQGKLILEKGKKNYFVDIPWKYQSLKSIKQSTPLKINFRLKLKNSNQYETKTKLFDVRSINDCILRINGTDLYELAISFVQEENPMIDDILKEGISKKYIDSWVGNQGSVSVDSQVSAVWKILSDRGIKYSSITGSKGTQGDIFYQPIRTFSQSLNNQQANCIDGSLVFCSILKKINIRTFLVITEKPSHSMFGYYDNDRIPKVIETTIIGSGASFNDALSIGMNNYIEFSKVSDNCHIIDVNDARTEGIRSINVD